jgi:hypothetical protein
MHTIVDQLKEVLDSKDLVVIPQSNLTEIVRKSLGGTTNQTKHLMNELGWQMRNVKWGGCKFSRAIWHRSEVTLDNGRIHGKGFEGVPISDYLEGKPGFNEVELIDGV